MGYGGIQSGNCLKVGMYKYFTCYIVAVDKKWSVTLRIFRYGHLWQRPISYTDERKGITKVIIANCQK